MPKISEITTVSEPKLSDKLIGTSVGGTPNNQTNNFTLEQLKELFEGGVPASTTLQDVLDAGNSATEDIYLTGRIESTNLEIFDSAYLTNLYLSGRLFDKINSVGTNGQILSSTTDGVRWITLSNATPTLQQVLNAGNIADSNITLTGDIQAEAINSDSVTASSALRVNSYLYDGSNSAGSSGQVLVSTGSSISWSALPSYSAISPLIYNSVLNQFSIQKATSTQNGYLSSSDWVNFDGKQNAGNYITELTGEATALGPGSAAITLNNYAVINKTLTGLDVLSGTVTAADSIISAFGKIQGQINGLVSGLIYKGVWNAATNVPTIESGIGNSGEYYLVDVAGNTDLDGITDWAVGDWAIFNGTDWQKIDNSDLVTSVNGQIGNVVLVTDDINEGSTNLYYTNTRARNSISSLATGLTYTASTGVFSLTTGYSIPTIANETDWTTAYNRSIVAAIVTGTTTKTLTLTQQDGATITADWTDIAPVTSVFGRTGDVVAQNGDYTTTLVTEGTNLYYLDSRARAAISVGLNLGLTYDSVTGEIGIATGYSIPTDAVQANWTTAYNDSIVSAAVTGVETKTLTLTQQDGGTITTTWTDYDNNLVTSVFGRVGDVVAENGDYSTTLVTEGDNLYFTEARARESITTDPGSAISYDSVNGVLGVESGFSIPTNLEQADWTTAYNNSIVSAAVTGTSTKTLTLNQEDGGTVIADWSDLGLTSVGLSMPSAFFVTNSPLTSDGTLDVIGSGTALQYIDGTGALQTFPILTGFVPYTGATSNVDLGTYGLITDFVEFNTNPTSLPTAQGTMFWDADKETVDVVLNGSTGSLFQDTYFFVKNQTGASIPKGTVVRADGTVGASGRILVAPFLANGTYDSKFCIGVTTELIADGADGRVTYFGAIRGIDTSLYPAGTVLYASPTSVGGFTATEPSGPTNNIISVAIVVYSDDNNGSIFVRPTYIPSAVDIAKSLNYTPANQATTLSINGTSYDLSANRSWNVGTVTSVDMTVPLGFTISNNPITTSGTLAMVYASGYSMPTNLIQGQWTDAYNKRIDSLTTTGTSGAATLTSNVLNIPQYQGQGDYITALTGEVTASGPGSASATLSNSAVTGKVLTGLSVTGSAILDTDSILVAFGKLQNQVNQLVGGLKYDGTWDAATNTPTITSGVGNDGDFYIVSVAGSTNIDGITDWQAGDWIVFHTPSWQKVDNTDSVTSVFGRVGAVTAVQSDYSAFYPLIADIKDGVLTVEGTGVLGGTGTFSANQATNATISISHDSVSRTNSTSTASPAFGGTFTAIDSITSSTEGHITAVNTKTVTIPSTTPPNNATITLSPGTGISGGGDFTTDQSVNETITFSHADTSTQPSVNNSGRTFIQDITLDDFGHVTGLVSATDTDTYVGTVTSVSGTGSYGGLSLSGTVTTSGNITLGGTPTGTWPISISGNAETVDGYSASTSTLGSHIVVRDPNGYIFGNYINMSDDGNPGSGTAITSFITKQGDNYYRSVSPTNAMVSIRGVASGTWAISVSGNASTATTATNSNALGGYAPSNYIGKNGNSYYQPDTWLQLNGHYGLYSPSYNNAHFYPNNLSYGSWRIEGSRNGWQGLHFGGGSGMTLMMNETEFGFHREGSGWYARFTNNTGHFNVTGSAGSVAWGNVSSKPSNIMYYQSFTLNADTMDSNSTGFTYSVNAPFTGPIARFSAGGSYDMWLGGNYGGGGNVFYIRTRNGDAGAMNPWRLLITDGNIGSQSVNYANSSNNANIAGYASSAGQAAGLSYVAYVAVNAYYVNTTASAYVKYGSNQPGLMASSSYLYDNKTSMTYDALRAQSYDGYYFGTLDPYQVQVGFSDGGSNYGYGSYSAQGASGYDAYGNNFSMGPYFLNCSNNYNTNRINWNGNDLYISGVLYQNSPSDNKFKDNVKPIENALDKVKAIGGVEFQWNQLGFESVEKEGNDVGVIAQDVQSVYPIAVREIDKESEDRINSHLVVDYEKLHPLALQAIKELSSIVDELKLEVQQLKSQINGNNI